VIVDALPMELIPPSLTVEQLLSSATGNGLSAYDAQYLELAIRTGARLLTADEALAGAAHRAGVEGAAD
jgi:predicted nucleic acid-binding protein